MSLSCFAVINKQKKDVFLMFAATMNCTVSAITYVCMGVGLNDGFKSLHSKRLCALEAQYYVAIPVYLIT